MSAQKIDPVQMNLPSDTPRLPKGVFFLAWACLLGTAWLIWTNAAHPTEGLALIMVVACVALAAAVVAIPFVADYARRQDEALDNRQRSLQALSVTVAAAAEQVSIAATGLQGIAEAAQDNFSRSEQLSRQIQEKIAELDARLAGAKRDDGETAARYEAAARKISKSAGEFEAAVAKAAEAARLAAEAPRRAPEPLPVMPEVPPVLASRIVEIRPAVVRSNPPYDEPARPPQPEVVPEPAMASEPAAEPAAAEPEPAPEPAAAPPPAPRRRSPRKTAPPPASAPQDLLLESPGRGDAPPDTASEIAEPAVSADGATRLIVTAYIGIGNRLFIRGEGPGLSWEKGVPLTFVSIGKWRWDTNDASSTVRFRLYKNDEMECTALGERSVEPGAQQELTASF